MSFVALFTKDQEIVRIARSSVLADQHEVRVCNTADPESWHLAEASVLDMPMARQLVLLGVTGHETRPAFLLATHADLHAGDFAAILRTLAINHMYISPSDVLRPPIMSVHVIHHQRGD